MEEKRAKRGASDRRAGKNSIPTLVMQGFEKMGTKGRRKLFIVGLGLLTAGGGVGLFGSALSLYRFVIVLLFILGGFGFIFPQFGILMIQFALSLVKVVKPNVNLLSRPDRRNDNEEEDA